MHSSQFGITFTDSRGPVNSDGPIHCIRSLNRMVRYSVMPVCVTQYFGLSSFADGSELHRSLNDSTCTAGRVQEYVSKWRVGVARLSSARFPFNVKLVISNFVRGLPMAPAFNTIRADMVSCISRAGADDMAAFIAVTDLAMELETVFHSANLAQNSRSTVPQRVTVAPPPPLPPVVGPPSLPAPVLA